MSRQTSPMAWLHAMAYEALDPYNPAHSPRGPSTVACPPHSLNLKGQCEATADPKSRRGRSRRERREEPRVVRISRDGG